MYNGLARKQVSLSEQDCCYVRVDLMLQQDSEERCEGDFRWNINSFRTNMAAPPPPPRTQSGPFFRGSLRCWTFPKSSSRVQEMCLRLRFSLGLSQLCITAACQHKNDTLALLHLLRFILSHIRASHSSTATTDTTTSTSHPRSRYPPLISVLNLVLLSGLCLYTPSEVSHFRKIRQSRHAA